jgi:hypothetical protein
VAPRSITDFQTISGSYDIEHRKEAESFCDQMSTFVKSHDVLFKKFNELSKRLVQEQLQVCKTIEELAVCTDRVAKAYGLAES